MLCVAGLAANTPSFVGEFLSLCGIFAQNSLSLVLSLIGVILSAVYSLWAYAARTAQQLQLGQPWGQRPAARPAAA